MDRTDSRLQFSRIQICLVNSWVWNHGKGRRLEINTIHRIQKREQGSRRCCGDRTDTLGILVCARMYWEFSTILEAANENIIFFCFSLKFGNNRRVGPRSLAHRDQNCFPGWLAHISHSSNGFIDWHSQTNVDTYHRAGSRSEINLFYRKADLKEKESTGH